GKSQWIQRVKEAEVDEPGATAAKSSAGTSASDSDEPRSIEANARLECNRCSGTHRARRRCFARADHGLCLLLFFCSLALALKFSPIGARSIARSTAGIAEKRPGDNQYQQSGQ